MKKKTLGMALRATALASVVLLGACVGDGDELTAPRVPATGGELFARYIALGNSITAGFQSGGLNDSIQLRAYPVLLAQKANAEFNSPLVPRPGCPRPFISPLGIAGRLTRPGGDTTSTCFRITNPRITNNVAVPGERIGDLLNFPTNPQLGSLHTLLVGPNTQLQALAASRPTFVTAWIGNNDALEAAVTGNLGTLTPTALFAARADSVLSAIDAAGPMDAVIIGVVDPNIVPILQPGAFFFVAYAGELAAGRPSPFGRPVNPNCAPGTPGGRRQVSFQILGTPASAIPQISCAADAPLVLNETESAAISASVAAFNQALSTGASQRGWLYVNPADLLNRYLMNPDRIRKCQGFATATTSDAFRVAIATTCPSLGNPAVGFGNLFSFDGVHPSTTAHQILADYLAGLINTRHDLNLPVTAVPAT